MKTVLISIDSKFIHSNLALRYIRAFCSSEFDIYLREFTINQRIEYIINQIVKEKPDIICFSTYIWNVEYIKDIVFILKTALPDIAIVLGGPEVSYDVKNQMNEFKFVDYIIFGEGEITFYEFLKQMHTNMNFNKLKGIAYRENKNIVVNDSRPLLCNLDELVSPYIQGESYVDKIVYYESSRGCPFRCSFCMSSIDKSVRTFSLSRVKSDLLVLLNSKARQIKFVDRTFNADYKRAMSIMKFIKDNNTSNSSIHFEITADIINDEFLEFLKTMPVNMFQFEIGVQTLNVNTLNEINRSTRLNKLFDVINKIKENNNMHMHLDLIAGLPYEDYSSFKDSFNKTHNLYAEQLQLGFLKVLKGTKMYENKEKYSLKFNTKAPYEIIKNKYISFNELLKLKNIEELVDKYYNEKYFFKTIKYIVDYIYIKDAFKFYEEFSEYWQVNDYYMASHKRKKLYEFLYNFMNEYSYITNDFVNCLLFDFVSCNQREELICVFNKSLEEDLKLLKREIAKDTEFRRKYFKITDDKVRILNNFRIIRINNKIILFVYKDKDNVFERCKTYDITNLVDSVSSN